MRVVAVKVPSGLTATTIAGSPAKSCVWVNACEIRVRRLAHSEPAESGPTDPDRVTVSPAAIELGLTWTLAGGVVGAAHAGAASSVSVPTVAANTRAAMMRTGRMATSPDKARPYG